MHDNDPRALLTWEIRQRGESGFDIARVTSLVEATLADKRATTAALTRALHELSSTSVQPDWPYHEPDSLAGILETLPTSSPATRSPGTELDDKILGAWLGRCAGCNLGKPIEIGDHWTVTRIREYLILAGAWPLNDYIPALDPMPDGFEFNPSWPNTVRGRVVASERDDDVDYSLLTLHLLETYGPSYSAADVAHEWLERLPYLLTYTAERAVYRHLVNGHDVATVGGYDNPYREWVGAQIRADVHGYVYPGSPRTAALSAYADASLSHRANGIYGAMWSAALIAAAFTATSPAQAVQESLRHIPPRSRLYEAIDGVLTLHSSGITWEQARQVIQDRLGHYSWVHTVNNAALVAAGILWGDGDFTNTITLTVLGGWDTDSNGATAGSVAGILTGGAAIPAHWVDPLHNTVRSALSGFDNTRISDLARRTRVLVDRFATAEDHSHGHTGLVLGHQ